ncbi:DUF4097 family beta strand repeat-containing protein [Nonomuraea typhae]|uniref:DUF4097 family beta strand repeat-containing protein n=1 Tax=Nonomuraea typhae TaxID=2603600 RepID=UPI0012F868B7|nr:DUF4097 family beta strand repeat-containing protein [Nonomuraea typhae]
MRKTIVLAGGLLASALVLTGCGLGNLVGAKAHNKEVNEYTVTDKVAKLRLSSGSGDTEIREGSAAAIKIVETLLWNSDKPKAEHKVEGDALAVTYDCPSSMDNCSVNYKIEVPKGLALELETGSGDISLVGVTGAIKADVGSGDLAGTRLGGEQVSVTTGSGDASLKYTTAPKLVNLVVGSGNAAIELPEGPYAIDAKTSSGDEAISVKSDPAASRKVTVRAGSGDVSVTPAQG